MAKKRKKASNGHGCLYWLLFWWWELIKALCRLIAAAFKAKDEYNMAKNGEQPELYIRGEKTSDETWNQIMTSQAELREQTNRLYKFRRRDLIEIGTSIEAITDAKVADDCRHIVNELCGANIGANEEPETVETAPQALTKTGKCPKCIVIAKCIWRWMDDSRVVCHVSYTADAEPYKADVLRLIKNKPVHYAVRTKDGEMQLVEKY